MSQETVPLTHGTLYKGRPSPCPGFVCLGLGVMRAADMSRRAEKA